MECINKDCNNVVSGRSKYCSAACKQAHHRNRNTVTDESVTQTVTSATVTPIAGSTVTHADPQETLTGIDHYYAHPELYVPRREPERMNWDKHMTMAELEQAGLKCNRVSIPGDFDYEVLRMAQDGQGQDKA